MVRPSQDAIETFMSITGASEAVALQMLEDHGGDLNGAVNAHFNEGDRNTHAASGPPGHNDFMNIDDPADIEPYEPTLPLLSSALNLNPFSLLASTFGQRLFDVGGASRFSRSVPQVSHPREVREIPIEFKNESSHPGSSGRGPTIEDVTGSGPNYGPEIHGTVTIDDDDAEVLPSTSHAANDFSDVPYGRHHGPSITPLLDVVDYNHDIEEEMIRAAIEASKRDVENSTAPQHGQKSPALEEDELARAVSRSLQTAEQERALHELGVNIGEQSSISAGTQLEDVAMGTTATARQGFDSSDTEFSSKLHVQEAEAEEEHQLVRHRSRQVPLGNAEYRESGQVANSPQSSLLRHDIGRRPQHDEDAFQRGDEWGGISSEEHDEAVMLEAALFGGIPEAIANDFAYQPHQVLQTDSDRNSIPYPWVPRPPSPTLTAQRLLREQQDDEYLAALQADRVKESKAKQETEAALETERRQEEETRRKILEQEECERKLAAKEASLPNEPSSDDESAVTLLVRMPDGSRRGRRFLKSDKLQLLFDYIDVGRAVKPGTYRLVRPYPRRAFTDKEHKLSLSELGLSSKQEALYLELI